MKHKAHWAILIIIAIALGAFIYSQSNYTVDIVTTPSKTKSKPVTKPVINKPDPVSVIPVVNAEKWQTYTDPRLKVTLFYPYDWSFNSVQSYPYSFYATKTLNSQDYNLVSVAQADGCRPDVRSMLAGQATYDTGWRGTTTFTRTVCLIDKNYLISLTAVGNDSKALEESMLSSIKIN